MKRFILFILLFCVLLSPASVYAKTPTEVSKQVGEDNAADKLVSEKVDAANSSEVLTVLYSELPTLRQQYERSLVFFKKAENEAVSSQDREALHNCVVSTEKVIANIDKTASAIASKDTDAIDTALTEHDVVYKELSDHLERYFKLNEGFYYGTFLLISSVISVILSLVIFIKTFVLTKTQSEYQRTEKYLKQLLFRSSLWPLIGSIGSYLWYLSTPPGGRYTIFTGLIIAGYAKLALGLYYYFHDARPALKEAKETVPESDAAQQPLYPIKPDSTTD